MTADERSRYATSRRISIVDPTGRELTLLAPRIVRQPATNGSYEIRPGDRLDLLAHAAFGDSTRWWQLADANPWHDAARLEEPGLTMELPDG